MTKRDELIALAERLNDYRVWNGRHKRYDAVPLIVEAAKTLRHLASQPSLYEAGREVARRILDKISDLAAEIEVTTGRFDPSQWKIEVPVTDLQAVAAAISALPADGGATDIQSSDGGVEGHAGVQSPSTPTSEALPSDSSTVGAGIKPGPSDTPTSGDAVRTIPHAEVDKIVADLIHANYSDKPRLALVIGRAIVKANRRGIDAALKPEAAPAGEVVCPTCSFTIRKREPVPFKIEDDCATPPAIEGTALSTDQRREEIARPSLAVLHQRAIEAAQAFEDAASYEEAMWTGWGDCVVPLHAEMRRVKAQQAVSALRDAQSEAIALDGGARG